MKRLLFFAGMCISLSCFSQNQVGKVYKPSQSDTIKNSMAVIPSDTTAFISADYFIQYSIALKKISYENYIKIKPDELLSDFYKWAILEWNRRQKEKK